MHRSLESVFREGKGKKPGREMQKSVTMLLLLLLISSVFSRSVSSLGHNISWSQLEDLEKCENGVKLEKKCLGDDRRLVMVSLEYYEDETEALLKDDRGYLHNCCLIRRLQGCYKKLKIIEESWWRERCCIKGSALASAISFHDSSFQSSSPYALGDALSRSELFTSSSSSSGKSSEEDTEVSNSVSPRISSSLNFANEDIPRVISSSFRSIRRGGRTDSTLTNQGFSNEKSNQDRTRGLFSMQTDSKLRNVVMPFNTMNIFPSKLSSSGYPSTPSFKMNRRKSSSERLGNASFLLDNLLSLDHYDKKIRPNFGGKPTLIHTDIEIRSFGPISENDMIYSMDCYFRQTWWDERLGFGEVTEGKGLLVLSLDWKFLQKVWIPDTYFYNGRNSYMHKVTTPNKFIRIRQDGQMRYSMRLTIKASCPMHLRKYPLDVQSCPLAIGSFGYSSKDVLYIWKGPNPVVISDDVTLSQYDFMNITTANITNKERVSLGGGEKMRSSIVVRFLLKRNRGYYILQIYAPCALIVGASWVSFWINKNDAAGRVSVGSTTVLTLVTMGFGGMTDLPRVTYATALDWFVVMCFAFVFTAMVEYACVNFIDAKEGEKIRSLLRDKIEEKELEDKKKRHDERMRKLMNTSSQGAKESRGNHLRKRCPTDLSTSPSQPDDALNDDDEYNLCSQSEEDENPPEACDECSYHHPQPHHHHQHPHVIKVDFECQVDAKEWHFFTRLRRKWRSSSGVKWSDMTIENLAEQEPTGGGMLDAYSRVGFPATFAILNIIYWTLYLHIFDDQIPDNFDNYTFL